jgi:hypothetical protein
MKLECAHEQDLLDAIAANRWPHRADVALREHVASCGICADVAEIAGAFLEDRDYAWQEAQDVPPASVVWWRAQVRAREEAARKAARPIVLTQAAAIVVLAVATAFLLPATLPWLKSSATAAGAFLSWLTPRAADVSSAFALATGSTLPLTLLLASVVVTPVFLYFVLADE